MKRALTAVLLLLAIVLSAAALAETAPFGLTDADGINGRTVYLFGADESIGLQHAGWLGWAGIEDFDALRETMTGDPAWALSFDSSNGLWVDIYPNGDGSSAGLVLTSMPEAPGTYTFTVVCEWDGQTVSETISLNIAALENLPDGANFPEGTVEVTVGEEWVWNFEMYPDGYGTSGVQRMDYELQESGANVEAYSDIWEEHITFYEPGEYTVQIGVVSDNISISRPISFRVTAPELRFWDGERANIKPVLPEEREGFWVDDFLMNLGLDNQEYYLELAGVEAPDYHWEQTAGPETPVQIVDLGEEGLALFLAQMQQEACELAYTVTADIGEYHAETSMTVSFIETDYPETMGFDRTYTLALGETVHIAADFCGGGWTLAGGWKSIILPEESELISAETDWIYAGEDNLTGMALNITGLQPGVASVMAEASEDGLAWRGTVTFIVLNEDGSRPDLPALAFSQVDVNRVNYKPIMPADSGNFSMDDFVMELEMENGDFYRDLTGEEMQVTWVQTSGPEMALTVDEDPDLLIVGTQSAPCDLTYDVTVSYGAYSVTTTMTVHFFDCSLPYATGFETAYTVGVGDTLTLRSNYMGTGWENSDYKGFFLMEDVTSDLVAFEFHSFEDHWEDYLTVTGLQPGVVTVKVRSNQDGLNWDGYITFMVIDGELPETSRVLNLPDNVETVEASSLEGTDAERINVNAGCRTIGARAFADCCSLLVLSIPDSVSSIADDALDGCNNLQFIIAPEDSYARSWAEAHQFPVWGD